jgi:hypothetical protein
MTFSKLADIFKIVGGSIIYLDVPTYAGIVTLLCILLGVARSNKLINK